MPSFGELPYDVQEKIPDFNVLSTYCSMADPVQRRIRINGHMYTEGKSLQQDLALVETYTLWGRFLIFRVIYFG